MKIGIAQINTDPRRISENVDKIISYIKKGAEAGADLVVFPELAIPGYACMDLILDDEYVERNLEGLQKIASSSGGIAAIVGFIDLDREKIRPDGLKCRYNSAALVQDGKLVGITDKTLLPEYDVFSEKRYFSEARNRKIFEIKGHNVGVMICEDMWEEGYPRSVAGELCERGAQVLVNLSASPFSVGKKQKRASIIGELIHRCGVPFVYVNAVGSHDGYEGEIVFDGFSMVFDGKGRLGATGRNFSEDFFVVDLDEGFSPVACSSFPSEVEEIYGALVLGIRDYARRCGFKSSCLGLSGGIDSAVVCALAADALGSGNVTAINMPARYSSKETRRDARKIAENLGAMFK
ncbi:MAG: NAD+ synthase, partial [Candidatus Dadabacteria bacterium]